MNKLRLKQSLFFTLALAILISITLNAVAAPSMPDLTSLAKTIEGMDFVGMYNTAPVAFDGIIYLIIFISVAHAVLGKTFQGPGGRAVTIGVGLALSFSLAQWSTTRSPPFMLGRLGPLAGLIIFLIIGLTIYRFVTRNREVGMAFWLGFAIFYITAYTSFPWLIEFLNSFELGRLIWGIINIIGVIAILMFLKNFSGGSSRNSSYQRMPRRSTERDRKKAKRDRENLREDEEEEKNPELKSIEEKIVNYLAELEKYLEFLKKCEIKIETVRAELAKLGKLSGADYPQALISQISQFESTLNFELSKCHDTVDKAIVSTEQIKKLISYANYRGYTSPELTKINRDMVAIESDLQHMQIYFQRP